MASTPDKKVPGILTIEDGGNIRLKIIESDENKLTTIQFINQRRLGKILGDVEDVGYVTLDDCFYTNYGIIGIHNNIIHVNKAFIGAHFPNEEDMRFNTFRFSVEGIDEWVGISGIKNNTETALIKYVPLKEVSINIINNMTFKIIYKMNQTISHNKIIISQKTYFQLESEQRRPIEDYIWIAHKITNFLGFALNKTVSIDRIYVTSDLLVNVIEDNDNKTYIPILINVYYPSIPHIPKKQHPPIYQMLFNYHQIADKFEEVINKWLQVYNDVGPSLHLYFSTQEESHKYIEGKFVTLIQGLESYHRGTSDEKHMDDADYQIMINDLIEHIPEKQRPWFIEKLRYANEISLSRRLKRLIEPFKKYFGSNKDRKQLIKKLTVTRNYLTHYDKSIMHEAASGIELWYLCQKVEAIFQLNMLQIIGFTEEEIDRIIAHNRKIRDKLSQK